MPGGVVGQGVITIGADGSDFSKDLKKQTEKAGRDAGESSGNALTESLGNVLKRGAQIVGIGVGATLAIGIKTAMESEVADMKFTQLFQGQTDKAKAFIEELKQFSKRTPFDFPGLQDAAGKFLSVGVAAERVIPLMTNIGNITSIMGSGAEGVRHATMALQQMAVAGKVTGGDMLQLLNANIPAWDLLSDTMGKPVSELRKMMEKGLIPAEAMFKALENTSGDTMSRFNGGMEKMALTTTGKLETLKDTFAQFAGGLFKDAMPAINGFVDTLSNNVIPAVEEGVNSFKKWITSIDFQPFLDVVRIVWDYVTGFVNDATVREWADRAVEGVKALAGWVKDTLVPALVDLGGKVITVINFFRDHEGAAKALGATIGLVSALIIGAWVAQGVVAVIEGAKAVLAWIATATASTTSATIQSRSTAQIVFGWAAAGAAAILHGAVIIAQWAWMGVQALLHAAKIALAWLIAFGPIGLVIAAVVGLVAIIIYNLETIKGWISSIWDWITKYTYDTWNEIWTQLEATWESITSSVSDGIENIKGWINTAWEWIKAATAAAWDKIKWFIFGPLGAIVLLVINNLDTIKAWISGAWEWIKATTSGAWNAVTSFISTAWDNIKRAVSERIESVVQFAREIPGKIVGALGDFGRLLFEKGKDVIQGLWDGMTEIWNKVTGWIGGIVSWIKEHKGPLSLDRELLKPHGSAIMKGFEDGLNSGKDPILRGLAMFTEQVGTIVGGRVSVGGKLLDTDTYARIVAALGSGFRINQGSWSNSVAASMGTHSGSGVVDLTPSAGWAQAVAALNHAGLRAIFRNWPGNQHIHLINPNVAGISQQALSQLRGEFSLARMGLGYAAGTPSAVPGWALVGERGPEWMRFRGGEQVLPHGRSPGSINVTMNVSVDDLDKMSKVGDFLDMLDRSRLDSRRTARSGMVSA